MKKNDDNRRNRRKRSAGGLPTRFSQSRNRLADRAICPISDMFDTLYGPKRTRRCGAPITASQNGVERAIGVRRGSAAHPKFASHWGKAEGEFRIQRLH